MGTAFTPAQVGLSATSGGQIRPYMNTSGTPQQGGMSAVSGGQIRPFAGSGQSQPQAPNILGPEAVRATGTGPFDDAYRQNLATYAGGLFSKPGGMLGLNPTGSLSGNPTGFGNAPVPGLPTSLLDQALGGLPFNSQPPPTPSSNDSSSTTSDPTSNQNWTFWLNNFSDNGSLFNTL